MPTLHLPRDRSSGSGFAPINRQTRTADAVAKAKGLKVTMAQINNVTN